MDGVHSLERGSDIDNEFVIDDNEQDVSDHEYVPDPRSLWGSEAARAMLVVLTRRLGPDFAREVSDEMAARTFAYQAGCPDDRSDGKTMEYLLNDAFWDKLFAMEASAK